LVREIRWLAWIDSLIGLIVLIGIWAPGWARVNIQLILAG
jgi:hypothetical protein